MKNLTLVWVGIMCSAALLFSQAGSQVQNQIVKPIPLPRPHRDLSSFCPKVDHSTVTPQSYDAAWDVAIDSFGNVLVTGSSSGADYNNDYATIKYDPSGTKQWVAYFNGPGPGYDEATAVEADRFGNVYVTGGSADWGSSGLNSLTDFVTIKYDSSGTMLWYARYDGPAHSNDYPWAMTTDASGNVYVTGSSEGPSGPDYATVKYNALGFQEWVARYSGPGGSVDYPHAIQVDDAGNVYVTGYGGDGCMTIKYSSSGAVEWKAHLDGCIGEGLVIDTSGNVYVAGGQPGNVEDFLTVKYNAAGVRQWMARYDGPGANTDEAHAIGLDDAGNVYVTGPSVGPNLAFNAATIKYSPAGVEQWVRRFGGDNTYSFQIVVDGPDKVYVGGYSNAPTPAFNYNFMLVKYDTAGAHEWTRYYDGGGNSTDYSMGLAVDKLGNVHITGESEGSSTAMDYATIKYDAGGNEQWVMRYDGTDSRERNHWVIASSGANGIVSPTGPVFASFGANQSFDILPDPDYHIDSVFIDGVYVGKDSSYLLANITSNHALYATFALNPNAIRYRSFVYDSLIVKKAVKKKPIADYWEFQVVNSTIQSIDEINVVFVRDVLVLLGSGELTPTGSKRSWKFTGQLLPGESVLLKGRSPKSGGQRIDKLWLGPATGNKPANLLPIREYYEYPVPNAANLREELFGRGAFAQTAGLVVGVPWISPPATGAWVRLNTPADLYKSLVDRSIMHTNIVTGFNTFKGERRTLTPKRQNNRLFADLVTLKINTALSVVGMASPGFGELRFVDAGNPFDQMLVRDIAHRADSLMTFYVNDLPLYAKLDETLRKINEAFSGPTEVASWDDAVRLRGTRRLLDVPYLRLSDVPPAAFFPTQVLSDNLQIPGIVHLYQNYPNPFNPTTTISFQLKEEAIITLKIYNTLGQEVKELIHNELMDEGEQAVEFDASALSSGVYYYKIVAQDIEGSSVLFSSMKKMLLIK